MNDPHVKGWRRVPIVDLCERHVDCVNRTAPLAPEPTAFKMIRTTNVRHGFIDTENVRYVSEDTYKRWTRRLVPRRGDIILTREAPLGDVGKLRTDDAVFLGQRLYHFRPDERKLDPDFLLYSLLADDLQGQIKSFGSGSTVEHMRLEDIPDLKLDVPGITLQKRIAGILAAYDELIENNQHRIRILEEMARALYREWFVRSRQRARGHVSETKRAFTDIANVLSGGTPKTNVAEYWNGLIPFFTPRDAPKEFYAIQTEKHVSEIGLAKCASELYPPETIFITARGTVGKVALASQPMAMNQSCYALVGKPGIPQRFLFLMVLEQVEYLKKNTGGATFDTIVVDTFHRMQVSVPSSSAIAKFSERTDAIFEQLLTLQRQIDNLRRTRDLLLPRLMSGALKV